jgi:hypothetical protein
MSTTPKDLFQRHTIPPSPLHDAVQRLARQEGWTPPWDREEQHEEQQSQKKAAGKKSGLVRGGRGELRRSIIQAAYAELKPAHKYQPYSDDSIDALQRRYLSFLGKGDSAARTPTPPTDDEVISLVSSIESFDDLEEVYFHLQRKGDGAARPSITLTDDELDLLVSVVLTIADLSETDRQALIKVSRETLIKGLKQLGVKSRRRMQRSR